MNPAAVVQPEVLARLGALSLTARQAVESVLAGQHRSVRHGLSVEFADHREYQPGDDLRHLDWLVLARSDRYQIRRYEEETRLRATLVLDASGSMGYGPAGATKLEYARGLAAALGYLMVRQNDSVGLATFDTAVREFQPPGSTMAHYLQLLDALARTQPGAETRLAPVLDELAGRFHVTTADVAALAKPVLRHRIICSFAAQAAGLTPDAIVERLVAHRERATAAP